MALSFDLQKRDTIDDIHEPAVYRFNLAKHMALLTGDSAIIRRFYQLKAMAVGATDIYKWQEIERTFFYNARLKNAFVYVGIIPWICESIVRLVASSGFQANSPLQSNDKFGAAMQKDLDEYLALICEQVDLQGMFERGVFTESGLGDFAFRISYDKELSEMPILEFIEPQFIEPTYKRGILKEIIIKEATDQIQLGKGRYRGMIQVHEKYSKKSTEKNKDPHTVIEYSFWKGDKEVTSKEQGELHKACKEFWGIDEMVVELPFNWFPVIFKKNNKKSELYHKERGVPDIQGIDSIEDALSEALSNLVDVIRKAAPKTFVPENLLPSNITGETEEYSAFDHEYLILNESGLDPTKLLVTTQAKIEWQSYIETAKTLISHAINKSGLSPTTLGVTGLESINSSSESQDAREKPSLRTRSEKLKCWKKTLEETINKYFQYLAFVNGEEVQDYGQLINVSFNEYINPSTENVVDVITKAVAGRVYSVELGVEKNFMHEGKDYTIDDIITESARIRGITPEQEMVLLGMIEAPEQTDSAEGDDPSESNKNEPTKALNEEDKNAK